MVELDNPQVLRLEFAFETKHFVALALECINVVTQIAQEESYFTTFGRLRE